MHPPNRSIVALAIIAACSSSSAYPHLVVVDAFVVPPTVHTNAAITTTTTTTTTSSSSTMLLSSPSAPGSKETDAERLLRRARELRNEVRSNEDELHATLISRKKARDAYVDAIISRLFPPERNPGGGGGARDDGNDGAIRDLCDRMREERLAADVLVNVVERLHEIEARAMGLEHVEPSVHHDRVTFVRVARPDDVELNRVRGCVDMLIRAAMVLDEEFMSAKDTECDGRIVSCMYIFCVPFLSPPPLFAFVARRV
jgi:hypothetical protein